MLLCVVLKMLELELELAVSDSVLTAATVEVEMGYELSTLEVADDDGTPEGKREEKVQ